MVAGFVVLVVCSRVAFVYIRPRLAEESEKDIPGEEMFWVEAPRSKAVMPLHQTSSKAKLAENEEVHEARNDEL